jgi:hypothetical protein
LYKDVVRDLEKLKQACQKALPVLQLWATRRLEACGAEQRWVIRELNRLTDEYVLLGNHHNQQVALFRKLSPGVGKEEGAKLTAWLEGFDAAFKVKDMVEVTDTLLLGKEKFFPELNRVANFGMLPRILNQQETKLAECVAKNAPSLTKMCESIHEIMEGTGPAKYLIKFSNILTKVGNILGPAKTLLEAVLPEDPVPFGLDKRRMRYGALLPYRRPLLVIRAGLEVMLTAFTGVFGAALVIAAEAAASYVEYKVESENRRIISESNDQFLRGHRHFEKLLKDEDNQYLDLKRQMDALENYHQDYNPASGIAVLYIDYIEALERFLEKTLTSTAPVTRP